MCEGEDRDDDLPPVPEEIYTEYKTIKKSLQNKIKSVEFCTIRGEWLLRIIIFICPETLHRGNLMWKIPHF